MNVDIYQSMYEVTKEFGDKINLQIPLADCQLIIGIRKWSYEGFDMNGPTFPTKFGLKCKHWRRVHDKYDLFFYGNA